MTVLDLPCGTGQSFDWVVPAIGPTGRLIGVDLSAGMLKKASARAWSNDWSQVTTMSGDARTLSLADLSAAVGEPVQVDRLLIFLGMTVFPDWRDVFAHLWSLLAPGGRCVMVDCFKAKLGFQGRMVNLSARADIRRPAWEVLEAVAEGYERVDLPSRKEHGGTIWLASGDKPA
ncbi:MAG: class I SAM-dependent methyltransferase [Proteobacteria bacterium]|nr:class I SAM-dependent methyltransferase [Pseudomonadota bacterium]